MYSQIVKDEVHIICSLHIITLLPLQIDFNRIISNIVGFYIVKKNLVDKSTNLMFRVGTSSEVGTPSFPFLSKNALCNTHNHATFTHTMVICTVPLTGRYVTIQTHNNDNFHLAEVTAFTKRTSSTCPSWPMAVVAVADSNECRTI